MGDNIPLFKFIIVGESGIYLNYIIAKGVGKSSLL